MAGRIYRRSDSELWYIDYDDEHGKRIRRSAGEKDQGLAQAVLVAALEKVELRKANKDRTAYKEAVVEFIKQIKPINTSRNYTATARLFDPILSGIYLD